MADQVKLNFALQTNIMVSLAKHSKINLKFKKRLGLYVRLW